MTMVDQLIRPYKVLSLVTLLCLFYDDMIAFDFAPLYYFTSSAIWDSLPDFHFWIRRKYTNMGNGGWGSLLRLVALPWVVDWVA